MFIIKLLENNIKGIGILNFKNYLFNENIKFNLKEFFIKNIF